ncbi:MAG: hypothetical protein ACRC78_03040 [Planktothrix sp.]
MPTTPQEIQGLISTALAAEALTQLQLLAVFPRTAVRDYELGNFERSNDVKIRRPRQRTAQSVDPRIAPLTISDPEFFSGTVTLDLQAGDAFNVYSQDPTRTRSLYVTETAQQLSDSLARLIDPYMYGKFRNWVPTVGTVLVGDNSPIGIVALEDSSGNLINFENSHLRKAKASLKSQDVPDEPLYAVIGTYQEESLMGDSTSINNFVAALTPGNSGGTGIYTEAIKRYQFIQRFGFNVIGSNSITGQDPVLDLDGAATNQTTLPIAAVAANNLFLSNDIQGQPPVGAVNITLTATALAPGVAVNKICRIGVIGSKAVAYGVIIRIDNSVPTAPVITIVPYSPEGIPVSAAKITPGTDLFQIPEIPMIGTAYHREALLYANRLLAAPSAGSGAVGINRVDPATAMSISLFTGGYDITRTREINAAYHLCGGKISDYRKARLLLSN